MVYIIWLQLCIKVKKFEIVRKTQNSFKNFNVIKLFAHVSCSWLNGWTNSLANIFLRKPIGTQEIG